MLPAGDEMGRTQHGNNNAYCQDNEISWVNWDIDSHDREFMVFVRNIIRLRKNHQVFRRRHFFQGRHIKGVNVKDILWLRPDGEEMTDKEWNMYHARCLGLLLHGDAIEEHDERGGVFMMIRTCCCSTPMQNRLRFVCRGMWVLHAGVVEIDTCYVHGKRPDRCTFNTGESYTLQGRSTALLRMMKAPR